MHVYPMRRLAMVAIAVVPAVALGAPAARAATPTVQQITAAMAAVQSYKMTMNLVAHTTPTSTKSQIVAILIKSNKTEKAYIKMQLALGQGASMNIEMVSDGKRSCIKGFLSNGWTCGKDAAGMSSSAGAGFTDVSQLPKSLSTAKLKPIGQKTVQGQRSDGFAINTTFSGSTAKGTLWVNDATYRIVEMDLATTTALSKGTKPVYTTATIVMSNYNDPKLTIPKV